MTDLTPTSSAFWALNTSAVTRGALAGIISRLVISSRTLTQNPAFRDTSVTVEEILTCAALTKLARYAWLSSIQCSLTSLSPSFSGTGHGVGAALNVHEGPQGISTRFGNTTGLQKGMIVSNEPGYYEDGAFGIRIEVGPNSSRQFPLSIGSKSPFQFSIAANNDEVRSRGDLILRSSQLVGDLTQNMCKDTCIHMCTIFTKYNSTV
jgi:hypothetical protein